MKRFQLKRKAGKQNKVSLSYAQFILSLTKGKPKQGKHESVFYKDK